MRDVRYVLVGSDGFVHKQGSLPADKFPPECPEESVIVVPEDRKMPMGRMKIDRRKIKRPINHVKTLAEIEVAWKQVAVPESAILDAAKEQAIISLDLAYANAISEVCGPLAAIHAEKRRQAEAGGGVLIVNEADRLAILENAAKEDEIIARLEMRRRAIKTAIKAATTRAALDLALTQSQSDKGMEADKEILL